MNEKNKQNTNLSLKYKPKSNKIVLGNRYVMKLLKFDLILLLKNKMLRSKLSKKPQNDKQSIQEKVFEPITSIIKIKSKKKKKKKTHL